MKRMEVETHSFITMTLGINDHFHVPAALPPGNEPQTLSK
jgi:hypothetical protein